MLTAAGNDVANMWPLKNTQIRIINENHHSLVKFLDSGNELMSRLAATSCFNDQQMTALNSLNDVSAKNKKMLEMLQRRSVEHFNQFLQCLDETQRHLLPLLTGDTGKD